MKKGFTLIELLVVIAIIGLLASVILASLNSARGKARDARRQSDVHSLQNALLLFFDDKGRYPSSADGHCTWQADSNSSFAPGGCLWALVTGKYIPSLPSDPSTGGYYSYDNWCNIPGPSVNNQQYRFWLTLENNYPGQLYLWWGNAKTYGATTCVDPS